MSQLRNQNDKIITCIKFTLTFPTKLIPFLTLFFFVVNIMKLLSETKKKKVILYLEADFRLAALINKENVKES